jgi:hypothetical protein
MPKKTATDKVAVPQDLEKSIKESTASLAILLSTCDKLKKETAGLEATVTKNRVKIGELEEELKAKQEVLTSFQQLKAKREAEEKQQKEREAKMRADIEAKIREEMEIKKRVDEEMKKALHAVNAVNTVVEEPGVAKTATTANKRKAIPKPVKMKLWNQHFTEDNAKGKCQVCSNEIKMSDFEAGHIISVANGGSDNIENLTPLCGQCNKSMGTQSVHDFKQTYFTTPNGVTPSQTCDILDMALFQPKAI